MIPLDELAADLRLAITEKYLPSRERALALTKLEEVELWLTRAPEDPNLT